MVQTCMQGTVNGHVDILIEAQQVEINHLDSHPRPQLLDRKREDLLVGDQRGPRDNLPGDVNLGQPWIAAQAMIR